MDIFTIPCTQLHRTQRYNEINLWDLQITGKSTPISRPRKNTNSRNHTFADKKYLEKATGGDLFENIFINFTFKSNNASFESTQLHIPEMKVLKKRKNGGISFQPIPRLVTPKRIIERPAEIKITSYESKRKQQTRRIIDLKQNLVEREKFFGDRKLNKLMSELLQFAPLPAGSVNPNLRPFLEFLSQLKQLCDQFIQNFTEPDLPRMRHKKQKKKARDPQAPKMPKSAFIFYFQDQKDKFLEKYPSLSFQDITKLIADEWKTLNSDQQQHYKEMAEVDRNRYTHQQKEYSQTVSKSTFSKFLQKKLKSEEKESTKIKQIIQKVDKTTGSEIKADEVEEEEEAEKEDQEDSFGADIVEGDS